jgi:hypothetical protein
MPWNAVTKVVDRVNPDFSGPIVWQEDQQATIKIIASRHDYHDQDLADAITATVNLDGYTVMRADFDMGGFKITNLLAGTNPLDAVNFTQLDDVQTQVTANAVAIAAINTSDPASIITAVDWDASVLPYVTLEHVRTSGNFLVDLKRFDDFKSGAQTRFFGQDLTPAATTDVDPATGTRFYMLNNSGGATNINIIRPTGIDDDLGEEYFIEGLVVIDNGAAPATLTLQADGVNVDASKIIGAPTANINTTFTLSYMVERITGDIYREAYVWSAP